MIARISGKLVFISTSHLIVDVHGIGYQVVIPLSTYYSLNKSEKDVSLFTYTHVREDALVLFGFFTEDEKKLFELLLSVSKVGTKLAINILSGTSVSDLISAVSDSNSLKLHSIPGVGKKTAERLILELKDKIKKIAFNSTEQEVFLQNDNEENIYKNVLSALTNLGYKKDGAEKVISKVYSENKTNNNFEDILRKSLQELTNAR